MSTVAVKRTPVEAKWNVQKIQQEAARAFAVHNVTLMQILAKHGGEKAIQEFQHEIHKHQLEHLKSLGVKTPLELAKGQS